MFQILITLGALMGADAMSVQDAAGPGQMLAQCEPMVLPAPGGPVLVAGPRNCGRRFDGADTGQLYFAFPLGDGRQAVCFGVRAYGDGTIGAPLERCAGP